MTDDECPHCGAELARRGDGPPWCPDCEWNLDAWDPQVLRARGSARSERRAHRTAFRVDTDVFAQFAGARPDRPLARTPGGTALIAVAVLIRVVDAALFVVGGWLLVQHHGFGTDVLGALAVVLGFVVVPRLGRMPRRRRWIGQDESPALHAVLADIAGSLGTAPPDVVVLDLDDTISLDRRGWRRRSVLRLGGRGWTTLSPQQRVAVLAHELAHEVDGDPGRSRLVEPVLNMVSALARATHADRTFDDIRAAVRRRAPILVVLGWFAQWPFGRVALASYLPMRALGRADRQRAEVVADSLAARLAGTTAMVSALDCAVLADELDRLVDTGATRRRPDEWPGAIETYLDSRREQLPLRRQHDARRSSLWNDHAPAGTRARLLAAWPPGPATVELSAADSSRIDGDLDAWISAVHRDVLGVRDFHGRGARAAG